MSKITVEQAKQKILKTIVEGLPYDHLQAVATAYKTLCEAELIEDDLEMRVDFDNILHTLEAESEGH